MVHLRPLQQLPLEAVKAFVFSNEIFGIALAERLEHYASALNDSTAAGGKNGSNNADDKGFSGDFLCLLEDNVLWGVIFASRAGLVLSCIPQNLPEQIFAEGIPALAGYFHGRKVYCVSGWSRGVQLIKAALAMDAGQPGSCNRQMVEHRRYLFLCYDSRRCQPQLVPQFPVMKCSLGDADALYHLQRAYDRVEVLPKNHPFKPETCRANLKRILHLGNVVAIPAFQTDSAEQTFMAKANFSAISWRFALIGGVYTVERHRKKGCAARLVQWLGDEAARSQRQAALFVREENVAARHAYENAGYFFSGNYEIVYW